MTTHQQASEEDQASARAAAAAALRFCGVGRGKRIRPTVSPPGHGSFADGDSVAGGGDFHTATGGNILQQMENRINTNSATAPKKVPEKPFPVTPQDENEQNAATAAAASNLRLPTHESKIQSMVTSGNRLSEEAIRSIYTPGPLHPDVAKSRSKNPETIAAVKRLEDLNKATHPVPVIKARDLFPPYGGPTTSTHSGTSMETNAATSRQEEIDDDDWTTPAASGPTGLYEDDGMSVIEGNRSRYPSGSSEAADISTPDLDAGTETERFRANFVPSSMRPDLSGLLMGKGPHCK